MEERKFEHKIKNAFKAYHPGLDDDEIWTNIEPYLKKKKKRRFFLLWWLVGGTIVISMGLFKLNSPDSDNHFQVTQKSEFDTKPQVQKTKDNEINISSQQKKINSTHKPESNFTKKASNSAITGTTTAVTKKATFTETELHSTNPLFEKRRIVSPAKSIVFLDQKQFHVLFTPHPILGRSFSPTEEKLKEQKTKLSQKNQFYLQPFAGMLLPIKHLNIKSGQQYYQQYLNARKSTESQLEAFGFGLNLQFKNKKGFILTSGLEFQQYNELFYQKNTSVTEEVITGTLTQTENALGEIINSTSGEKTIKKTVINEYKFYNHSRFVNLTFGAGKSFIRKNWEYAIQAGLEYNLIYSFAGTVLDDSRIPLTLKKHDISGYYNNFFKSKSGFALWFSTEFHKPVNRHLSWFVNPKIRIPLSSLTADNNKLSQRYYSIALNFGIKYSLQKVKVKIKQSQNDDRPIDH